MKFKLPPQIFNEHGEKRRVGFELEYGGLDLHETGEILVNLFAGKITASDPYRLKIATSLGEFLIEADSNFLKKKKYEKYLTAMGMNPQDSAWGQNIEQWVGRLAGTLIPFEIVSPPLPIDHLQSIEQIRGELFRHSAKGTHSSIFMAFGMQFNPEVPDKKASTLLRYLRAFFVLFDWLYEESDIPMARKVAPFINDFPEDYVTKVLNPDYQPELRQLMIDYLTFNPTRNRPLDLLPLFTDIDRELVFSFPVEQDLVKARPTFHYRLPSSLVDDPRWSIAEDWNKWVEIERLVAEDSPLDLMSEDFFTTRSQNLLFVRSKWAAKTRQWLYG